MCKELQPGARVFPIVLSIVWHREALQAWLAVKTQCSVRNLGHDADFVLKQPYRGHVR